MKIDINKKYRYRNGEPARIICVDAPGSFPFIAIGIDGVPTTHLENGRFYGRSESEADLIEVREPRELFINIYSDDYGATYATAEEAALKRGGGWVETIRVREIID